MQWTEPYFVYKDFNVSKNTFPVKVAHPAYQIALCFVLTTVTEKEIPVEVHWNFPLPYDYRTYIQFKT
jgi:hypothetical protein